MAITKITEKDFVAKEEVLTHFFKCHRCDCESIMYSFKFCPNCGNKINVLADYDKCEQIHKKQINEAIESLKDFVYKNRKEQESDV